MGHSLPGNPEKSTSFLVTTSDQTVSIHRFFCDFLIPPVLWSSRESGPFKSHFTVRVTSPSFPWLWIKMLP